MTSMLYTCDPIARGCTLYDVFVSCGRLMNAELYTCAANDNDRQRGQISVLWVCLGPYNASPLGASIKLVIARR